MENQYRQDYDNKIRTFMGLDHKEKRHFQSDYIPKITEEKKCGPSPRVLYLLLGVGLFLLGIGMFLVIQS